jgi:putative hemolysin
VNPLDTRARLDHPLHMSSTPQDVAEPANEGAASGAGSPPTAAGPIIIDLRQVIASKNPSLLTILPGFVIRLVERIVHVRGLNRAFRVLRGKTGIDFITSALDYFGVTVVTRGEHNLPQARRALVVANHPLGGMDGMALMQSVSKQLGDTRAPVNDLLMNLPQLQSVLVPVNRHGSNVGNIGRFEDAFSSGTAMVHFPAGLCSRQRAGRIRDLTWQKSFIVRARRYERDIVPVHIDGRNSRFFYNLARLRRWSGIKFNFEMIFLVDEMFKQRDRTLTLTFGAPIRWESLDKSRTDWEWARQLRRHVYRLASNPDAGIDQ